MMANKHAAKQQTHASAQAPISKAKQLSVAETKRLALDKLKTSLLDEKDAKLLGVAVADPSELGAAGFPVLPAMELPYFCPDGKLTGFKRWRYLADTRTGFAAKTTVKPLRYVQTPGSPAELYLPPFVDWRTVMSDISVTLAITEGELKAACCSKHAMPCVGLGGVYSFKSTRRKLPLLPLLHEFKWEDRVVVVAYDSDAHTNPMVVAARNELCRELLALGALPHIADISPSADGIKRGLDDLALQDGIEALALCLEAAEAFAPSAALHELNAEVAYVRNPGLMVVMDSGLKMRPSDFTNHAYANRHYWEIHQSQHGERMVKKKAAAAWLEWPKRLELARMAYAPGLPRITEARAYNTWPGWGCEPKKGDVKPWRDLLDYLFAGNPAERSWFERWCALPLQQPGAKMYTAAVLWGVNTGTGKSLVGYSLGRIYGENFTEIGDSQLEDDRNEWAMNKQFVMGDDVTGNEQRKYADKLKRMVTQQEIRIDQKFVPSYTVADLINYFFTSNHPDAFFMEDDDRRNFIHEVRSSPMPRAFYKAYMTWLNGDGPSHLFHHLLELDLKGMDAEDRAPETEAKSAMLEAGLSDLGRWVRKLREEPDLVLRFGEAKLQGDLWSAVDLLKVYDPEGKGKVTAGGLARELRRAGLAQTCDGRQVRTANGQQRLFIVRASEKWLKASAKEAGEHYDLMRCPPKSKAKSASSRPKF